MLCRAGESLLASQQSGEARAALVEAINSMLALDSSVEIQDRRNRRQFRTNLSNFVVTTRGIVRLR